VTSLLGRMLRRARITLNAIQSLSILSGILDTSFELLQQTLPLLQYHLITSRGIDSIEVCPKTDVNR
jgi:hypothetical protein